MTKVVPFSIARGTLSELLDDVQARHEHVVITRNGRPAAVVVSTAEWEAIQETLEVLEDETTLSALRESEDDMQAGRVTRLEDVRRELGLA
jgi:antitoxin YefM